MKSYISAAVIFAALSVTVPALGLAVIRTQTHIGSRTDSGSLQIRKL